MARSCTHKGSCFEHAAPLILIDYLMLAAEIRAELAKIKSKRRSTQ